MLSGLTEALAEGLGEAVAACEYAGTTSATSTAVDTKMI
jgi:hypothetical protein